MDVLGYFVAFSLGLVIGALVVALIASAYYDKDKEGKK